MKTIPFMKPPEKARFAYLSASAATQKGIVTSLVEWYRADHRILPWRSDPSPYKVWISEIMLQQTRVEAVKPYFARFMEALPDVKSLAGAQEDSLLKLWEGLGYYNRARNLQKAAVQIMEDYGGRIPGHFEELCKLPGIGSYTAGAIASIAFGQPVPAVDGNVLRVMARVSGEESDIADPKVKAALEEVMRTLMPQEDPGDFNQGLMELGAVVCVPNGAPKCHECPLMGKCVAKKQALTGILPNRQAKKPRVAEEKTILQVTDGERFLLRKRPPKGLLAGLYEPLWMEGHQDTESILAYIKSMGLSPVRIRPLPPARHIFTHREWDMKGYLVLVEAGSPKLNAAKQEMDQYAVPSAYGAFMQYL